MPGQYPESEASLPPLGQHARAWPVTPTPSPPHAADSQITSRSQTQGTIWSRLTSWLITSPNAIASPSQPAIESSDAAPTNAPPVPAQDQPGDARQPSPLPRKYMSITERLDEIRRYEDAGTVAPPELRQSYPVHASTRDSTQQKISSPQTKPHNKQSLRLTHNLGLRESLNGRDQDVEGLIQRLKIVSHESFEDYRIRERLRLRNRRLADEKGLRGRAQQRAEEERRVLEEEAAQEVRERLEAEREAERKAQEEQKEQEAFEAAQLAKQAEEEARKNTLIRPLEPEWAANVQAAMSITNPQKVFSKSPDGTDITRYVLGRILPQQGEHEVIASNGGQQGNSAWLNDECVDIWISFIVARRLEQEGYVKGPNNIPSTVAYLSAFWKTYKSKGAEGIKTWSRRKGIAGKKLLKAEKIFFPINSGAHWILLVISPKTRTIEVLDSLLGSPSAYFRFAHEWLAMELGSDYNKDEWQQSPVKSSVQHNFDDCGVFTCVNALASAKNMAASDVISVDGMKDARRMMVAVLLNEGFKEDWEL